ncbi:MAG: hypothetical protein WDN00_14705 [Limisphaerales bacterium]
MFVPDVIVLDLMMPKFSGEEVLQYVCTNPRLSKVPLITFIIPVHWLMPDMRSTWNAPTSGCLKTTALPPFFWRRFKDCSGTGLKKTPFT